jgi:hypothetical protein
MFKNIVVLIFLVFTVFSLSAQEKKEISKDVKVVKAYTPSLSDAFKVNRMPVLKDSVGLKPQFNYSILSKAMITGYSIEPITPARLAKERPEKLKTSYFKAAFGNYGSMMGDLNYNILQSEQFVLGLNVGHWSSFGNIKLEDGKKVDAPFHDTWANVGFDYLFNDKTLYTNIDFKHNIYDYYGYNTIVPALQYWVPAASKNVTGDLLIPDSKQRLSSFDFQVGLKNNRTKLKHHNIGSNRSVRTRGQSVSGELPIAFSADHVEHIKGWDYVSQHASLAKIWERPSHSKTWGSDSAFPRFA